MIQQAEANIAKAESDVAAAQARQKVAEANLAHTKTMINYLEIKAPFDGVVTRRNVDTGYYVQSTGGANPLLVIARNDRVRVFVDIPESEAALVDAGDPATVFVQALRGREVQGTVTRTSWALDPMNRSIRTEIDLANDEGALRPGMYATVKIRLDQRDSALTLPATAIVRQGRDTFCCRVEGGKIVRSPITLGLRSGADIEVLSGLTGNETVVLLRADSLRDGQPVEVMKPEGAS
jgi:RND family efflux transporter MFP subunit